MSDLLVPVEQPLRVERLLPPGTHLPTADEDTSKFRSERFTGTELEDWRVLDYGMFVVAMAAFEVASGDRVSLMPTKTDFQRMREAGFGPSVTRITREYGGLKKLQADMGFYPYQYRPDSDELTERFAWIADSVIDIDRDLGSKPTIKSLLNWCSLRDLAPHAVAVYEILDGDVDVVRALFGLREKDLGKRVSYTDMYKLGAKVLKEVGHIPLAERFREEYGSTLPLRLQTVLESNFGGYNKFWLEFDRIYDTSGMAPEEIVNFVTRFAIRTGENAFERPTIENYAARHELPSVTSIDHRVGGLIKLREQVAENLEVYEGLITELEDLGISRSTARSFCAKFEPTDEFKLWIMSGKDVLCKLSAREGESVEYLKALISGGFDLINEDIFEHQLVDFTKFSKRFGIRSLAELRFIAEAIPRVNTDEFIQRIRDDELF